MERRETKTPDMPPVSKEDVLSIPRFLREYEPIIQEHLPAGDGITRWNIPREDGKHLAIGGRAGAGRAGFPTRKRFLLTIRKEPTGQKSRFDSPPAERAVRGILDRGFRVSHLTAKAGKKACLLLLE